MEKLSKTQIEKYKKSQGNPLYHPDTCMGYKGCTRPKELNEGILIATGEGIKCPCGNYSQEYPETLAPTYSESKNKFPNLVEFIEYEEENNPVIESPYCPICEGCGESGCCSPLICEMSVNGKYCQTYLRDLKMGYELHGKLMDTILDDGEHKKVNEIEEKLYDELFDKYYPKNNE